MKKRAKVKLSGPWDLCGMVWQHGEHRDILRIDMHQRNGRVVEAYTTKRKMFSAAKAQAVALAVSAKRKTVRR